MCPLDRDKIPRNVGFICKMLRSRDNTSFLSDENFVENLSGEIKVACDSDD